MRGSLPSRNSGEATPVLLGEVQKAVLAEAQGAGVGDGWYIFTPPTGSRTRCLIRLSNTSPLSKPVLRNKWAENGV